MATRTRSTTTRRRSPVTADDLRSIIGVADPQISPDGESMLFVRTVINDKNAKERSLWLVGTSDGAPHAFTTGTKDRQPRWSPDALDIAFVSERDDAPPQIHLMAVDGGEAHALTAFPEGSIGELVWSPDGRMIAVSFRETDPEWTKAAAKQRDDSGQSEPPRVLDDLWYRLDGDGYFNAQRFALYIIDVETGEHTKLYDKDRLGFFSFDWSPTSREVVVATNEHRDAMLDSSTTKLIRINVRTKRITTIPNLPEGPKSSVKWSPDGASIAYAGREGIDSEYSTENLQLWVCNAQSGRATCLTKKHDYCLMAPALSDTAEVSFSARIQWSRDSRRLYCELGWHGETHIASIPKRGGALTFLTSGKRSVTMGNLAENGKSMSAMVTTVDTLPEIHAGAVSASAIKLSPRTALNKAWRDEHTVCTVKSHWIATADNTKVQLWVMMPPKASARKKYPAVLEIHGGPHAQYGVGFFHEFQMLANAGYVVVFANPRGSKGYGREHCSAIRGAWGTSDWVDMQAVIDFMTEQSYIDTKRMAVMGGSYGGYMTNWIIGHTRQFAAAITDRCVSNVMTLMGSSDFTNKPDHYWPGNTWDNIDALWDQSPLRLAGHVKTPTLIIHSEGDLRCNVEQAEQYFTALKLNRVPCRFVRYPRSTSHGMSRSGPIDLRIHRLEQIRNWLDKYLKPRGGGKRSQQ
ncbi:MAG: S9 family peptidase [Planctomycetota bacterium]